MMPFGRAIDVLGRLPVVVAMMLLTGGCSATDIVNALSPRQGFNVLAPEQYGAGPRRSLDIYRPANAANAPVVVFFYGGSWQSGSRTDYAFVGSALARLGYITVIPDYRVYPEVKYPAFLEDAAAAVGWAKRNAKRLGGDPRSLFVVGHSAGAYIAAMMALDRRWLARQRLDAGRDLAGWVGISGPYDFLPLEDEALKVIFAGDRVAATQPITYADRGNAPALLLTGNADTTVLPRNTRNLATRLRANQNSVTDRYYPGVGHAQMVGAFAPALSFLAPTLNDVDEFIRARSQRRPAGAGE
jgi:acetyl esterase/lipase